MEKRKIVNYVIKKIPSISLKEKIKKEKYDFEDMELIYFIDQYSKTRRTKIKYLEALKQYINDNSIVKVIEKVINYKPDMFELFYGRFHSVWDVFDDDTIDLEKHTGIICGLYRPLVTFFIEEGDKVKYDDGEEVFVGIVGKNRYGSKMNPCRVYISENEYIECKYEELEFNVN